MIRISVLMFIACCKMANAACMPSDATDRLEIKALNRAFVAQIDRTLIALSGEDYCALRPSHRRSLSVPVKVGQTDVPVSVTPLANMIFPCRTLSRGMALTGQSEEGLLYTDDSLNVHSLACFSYKGSLTLSCYADAASCRLWNIRDLGKACHVWIFASIPKAVAVDWRAIVDQIDTAIVLKPACDGQA